MLSQHIFTFFVIMSRAQNTVKASSVDLKFSLRAMKLLKAIALITSISNGLRVYMHSMQGGLRFMVEIHDNATVGDVAIKMLNTSSDITALPNEFITSNGICIYFAGGQELEHSHALKDVGVSAESSLYFKLREVGIKGEIFFADRKGVRMNITGTLLRVSRLTDVDYGKFAI